MQADRHRLVPTVDLHCHLLPGLDDGARDLADAVAMARQAEDDGIGAICATPHIRHDHDVRICELAARVARLSTAVGEAGCSVRVLTGGEVAASALERLTTSELAAVSLGGSGRWVLLEPAPGPLDARLEKTVGKLHAYGFRALIAHPERHLGPELVDALRRLVAAGALVQGTAAFLVDEATRPGMLALARSGLIHVLGTDAHSARIGRPVALSAAVEILAGTEPTASQIEWIAITAPSAIVAGEDLSPPFPTLS